MNNDDTIIIEKDGWRAAYCTSPPKMTFHLSGEEILAMTGVAIGGIQETASICGKAKSHQYSSFDGGFLDIVNVLPFGAEPEISRKCYHAGNHFKIVTDINFRGRFASDSLSVDTLRIGGGWTKVGVLSIEKADSPHTMISWKWMDCKDVDCIEYADPPLLWLFEDDRGARLEIGTGDDLWRWKVSSRLGAASKFILKRDGKDGSFSLVRQVICAPENLVTTVNNMRFSWYFSWELPGWEFVGAPERAASRDFTSATRNFELKPGGNGSYSFNSAGWPEPACVVLDGAPADLACLHSAIIQNRLKTLIRRSSQASPGNNLMLTGLEPSLCESASHLDRPQKKTLQHWSILAMLDFWLWANKHMADSGSRFFMIPDAPDGLASRLPSLRGLSALKYQ